MESKLEELNKKLFNAGFSFKLETFRNQEILILGSFDFAYGVQLHIHFDGVSFSNLSENETWSDFWNDDQIFQPKYDFKEQILEKFNLELKETEFLFKINSQDRMDSFWGIIVAKSLRFNFFG